MIDVPAVDLAREVGQGYTDTISGEIHGFFSVCRDAGVWPGGVHIELTGEDVTEWREAQERFAQAEKLAADFASQARVTVDWAMRYGNPSIASKLDALQQAGCERILLVPLYPQYAAATTATACDQAFRALMAMRWQPARYLRWRISADLRCAWLSIPADRISR